MVKPTFSVKSVVPDSIFISKPEPAFSCSILIFPVFSPSATIEALSPIELSCAFIESRDSARVLPASILTSTDTISEEALPSSPTLLVVTLKEPSVNVPL